MQNYFPLYAKVPLFRGIASNELQDMLNCLQVVFKQLHKSEMIIHAGTPVYHVGVVMEGGVEVSYEDVSGNRNVLSLLGPADVFAESFACAGTERSPVTVTAVQDSVVMQIDFRRIITPCCSGCAFHARMIENMMRLMAKKNIALSEKIYSVGRRTLQEKIETFLQFQHISAGKNPFDIPFSRAAMADYLCVDRSALSAALSRMQDEGLIRYHRNQFELINLDR